jgi:hypothetical protein
LPAEWQGSCAGSLIPYLLYDAYKKVKSKFRSVCVPDPEDPDPPDPHVFGPPGSISQRYGSGSGSRSGSGSFYHPQAEIVRKTFIPTYRMYLQKVISRKTFVEKLVFYWHLEGQ